MRSLPTEAVPMTPKEEPSAGGTPLRLEYERELLFGEAIEIVAALLESHGISQRELAERLELSEARVSRLLQGAENVTLKTIADVGYALGIRFTLAPVPFDDRRGTPAAEDPVPPGWIDRQRHGLAGKARARGRDEFD